MYEVEQTSDYDAWYRSIGDQVVRGRISSRIVRLKVGNFGDAKAVGNGVHELRLNFGPGYRVYFSQRGARIILLLCGGDKSSQQRDIARAKLIALEWK